MGLPVWERLLFWPIRVHEDWILVRSGVWHECIMICETRMGIYFCQLFNYHVLRTDSEDLNFCVLWTSFSVLLIYVLNMVGFCPITLLGKHNCCPKTPKVITKLQSSLLSSLILSLSSILIFIINKLAHRSLHIDTNDNTQFSCSNLFLKTSQNWRNYLWTLFE